MLSQFSLTPEQLRAEFTKAKAGKHILYHIGNLQADRQFNANVNAAAKLAAALYDLDLARLFQKRINGYMNYFIIPLQKLRRTESRRSLLDAERLAQL